MGLYPIFAPVSCRPAIRAAALTLALGLGLAVAVPARAEEPFRIGTSGTGLLVWIAQAMGAFDDAGVEVEIERLTSGVEGLDRTENGTLDLAASSEFAFTTRVAGGADLCIYGTLSASRTVQLLAHAGRVGPAPADLAGKRIGVTQGSVARFFLWQYLALEQVPEEDVVLVDLIPKDMVRAMRDGEIDAAIVWEPHATQIRELLRDRLVDYRDQSMQHYYFVLQGPCDLERRRPEALRAVLAALIEADALARRDPERAKRYIMPVLRLGPAEVDRVWPKHSLGVVLPQDLLLLMEMEARWLQSAGLAGDGAINALQRVRPQPLADVAPAAVQMVW
ncbi:ABC transporter substrate-binding protein [Marinibaculum pumilum]|uniref:ABC transporter substrate-binding protein n=1 Tax=Marinibaculum pumilum TaxID=1766165 RepID=A0ABV7L9G3_9PROT